MLLRISLIVAIVASVATLVVSHLQLAQKIQEQKAALIDTQDRLQAAQTDLAQANRDLKETKDLYEQTAKDLDDTQAQLEVATNESKTQRARADRFENELFQVRGELTQAQRNLAAWNGLSIPVDQVRSELIELAETKVALSALGEEKRILLRKINNLNSELDFYKGPLDLPPRLPEGLKGHVVAVDSTWDFVILDIGGLQGVLPRGELLVNRGGKLVAKVRVTEVEDRTSIANVLPEWKQAEVLAGDQVLPSL